MNDLLQQLVGMGPGIGAAVSGNGNAFASFMDGWQRAQMRDQQQKRLTQQDAIAAQDRDRMIGRQEVQDARAAEDQEFQRNARNMSVAGTLGQAASGAESIPEGEAAIDTLFRVLSPQAQQTMAPARDAALSGVQRTVTGRQKKQVEAFVEAAVKTAHVADNPDADPELINLPEHIQRIVGKPSARLSELQQFAQLPVGKPQGKTRVPPASGSMEEFSDPNITPERKAQILADRKAYMQSDDRAPRVTVNTGANEGRVNSRIDRITNSFNTAPIVKEFNEVQAQHQTIAQIVNSKWSGPGDMSVVFAFMKALDPNSVVRETEYANAAKSGNIFSGWAAKFNGALNPNGGFLSDEVKRDFLRTIEARMGVKRAQYDNLRKQTVQKIDRIRAGAPETGEEAVTDYGAAFPPQAAPADGGTAPTATGPKPGERRKAPDGSLVEWDGKGWKPVRF
jgi:hypothetical protein